MKPCRMCWNAEVAYYGGDCCAACLAAADRRAFAKREVCPVCHFALTACDCLLPGEAAREATD